MAWPPVNWQFLNTLTISIQKQPSVEVGQWELQNHRTVPIWKNLWHAQQVYEKNFSIEKSEYKN